MIFELLEQIGNCQLYTDFRSGSFRDWSGNSRIVTPSSDVSLSRHGALLNYTGDMLLTGNTAIDFGSKDAATIVTYFPDGYRPFEGAINYFLVQLTTADYFGYTPVASLLYFSVNGVISSKSWTLSSEKYISTQFSTGDKARYYLDGVYLGEGNNTLTKRGSSTTNNMYLGTSSGKIRQIPTFLGAFLIFDKALSATEHAELYGALHGVHWPQKVYSHGKANLQIETDDTALLAAYGMKPTQGKVFDISGNGYDAALNEQRFVKGNFEHLYDLEGNTSVNTGITKTKFAYATESHTVEAWLRIKSLVAGTNRSALFGRGCGGAALSYPGSGGFVLFGSGYGSVSRDKIFYYHYETGTPEYRSIELCTVELNQWIHAVYTLNYSTGKAAAFYNGVKVGEVNIGSIYNNATVDADGFRFFGINITSAGASESKNTDFAKFAVYSGVKSDTWIAEQYAKGAKTLQFQTTWAARETTAAVTSGNITNTPIEVLSGSFSIGTEAINGKLCKVLTCVSAGIATIPVHIFGGNPNGAAYGTWEFYFYKADSNAFNLNFVADIHATSPNNGYKVSLNANEAFLFIKYPGGSVLTATANGYYTADAWHKFAFTRGTDGKFTFYIDDILASVAGGSGSNPITDTSFTSTDFVDFYLNGGGKLALGAVDGSYSLKKRLGVYNGD